MQEKWLSCKLDEVEMSKCKTWAGLTMAFAAWCCLQLLLAAVSVHGQSCSITLHNNCSQGVRACVQASWFGNPSQITEYDLVVGASQLLEVHCTWQGTIWRTRYSECSESGSPGSPAGKDLCNLAEINMEPGSYSLSNVNAFNSGLRIDPVRAPNCTPISCAVSDLNFICDGDNQLVVSNEGYFVSCINTDGSRGLGPTDSTQLFKQACPSAYSYNHDDATSTFTCHGTPYLVTFCPTYQSYW